MEVKELKGSGKNWEVKHSKSKKYHAKRSEERRNAVLLLIHVSEGIRKRS